MKIIVNADDFGRSKERNQAIDDAFRQGLISSAGLIVTGKYMQDAVDYIHSGGYADRIHLHLNLSTSMIDDDSEDVPLTEAMRKDLFFCTNGKFTPFDGLPSSFSDIRKWKVVYHEMAAQYHKFREVTKGKSDYGHIDFHLWYNLTWPVTVALKLFTRRYGIHSVRFIGMHQRKSIRFLLYRVICWNPHVRFIPSSNIDYYLYNQELYSKYSLIELYCHPHYKNGVFLDDSPSYLKHEMQPMQKQIQRLKESVGGEFVSWKDCCNWDNAVK